MSFQRQYLPLFSIRVLNNSTGNAIVGAMLKASNQTQKALNNHHLLAKSRDYGLDVFYSTNPQASNALLGPITSVKKLDFELHLSASFYSEYLPDLDGSTGKQLHLQNLNASGAVVLANNTSLSQGSVISAIDAVKVQPLRFEVRMNIDGAATEIQVSKQFDPAAIVTLPVTVIGNEVQLELDLTELSSGHYRLATDSQMNQYSHVLLDNELASARAMGLISVYLDQLQTNAPANGYQFEARFDPR